jgi:hypothetical protein
MGRIARTVGAASIVLVPALVVIADELRMSVEPEQTGSLVDAEYGVETVLADLAAIDENRGTFVLAASISYVAVLLTMPLLVAVWRLSVRRAPAWAWTSAVLAALGVCGLIAHTLGYYGFSLAALEVADRTAAAEFLVAAEQVPFVIAVYAPFFLSLLVWLPQAIGLFRARTVPLWSPVAVGVAVALDLAVGSTVWSMPIWGALIIAGFAPAARALFRTPSAVDAPAPQAVPSGS